MKKLYTLLISILSIILLVCLLLIVGIQKISTDKNIYSFGENVTIHWSDLSFKKCSCNKEIKIFRETRDGWKQIQRYTHEGNLICVNNEFFNSPYGCDVFFCSNEFNFNEGSSIWNLKMYEYLGQTTKCGSETFSTPKGNYQYKYVPRGKYKINFGNSQKIIEIN